MRIEELILEGESDVVVSERYTDVLQVSSRTQSGRRLVVRLCHSTGLIYKSSTVPLTSQDSTSHSTPSLV